MVARPESSRFTPAERPALTVALDGTLAAVAEPTRIVVVELPSAIGLSEIGTDPEAVATEVAWVAAPSRLLVLSRYAGHSTVHLLDPHGPRSLAEIRLESPMRLFAAVGAHALMAGAQGAAILNAGEAHLTPYQFPSRTIPLAAGAAAGQFLVALPAAIEEWDPQARVPKRRLRLGRPATITALGGSERVIWMTTAQDPSRIDVIPLVSRGQPKQHDLPEPIALAVGHPRSDLVLCVGAESRKLYVVDLDGRKRLRVIALPGVDEVEAAGLVVGRVIAALGSQTARPLALLPLDEAPLPAEPTRTPALEAIIDEPAKPSSLSEPDFAAPPDAPSGAASSGAASPGAASSPSALALALAAAGAPRPTSSPLSAPSSAPSSSPSSTPSSSPSASSPALSPPSPASSPALTPPSSPSSPGLTLGASAPSSGSSPGIVRPPASSPGLPLGFTQPAAPPSAARQAVIGAPAGRAAAPDLARWRDDVVAWSRAVAAGVDREAPAAPPVDALVTRFDLPAALRRTLVLLYGAHLCGEPGAAPVDVARVNDRTWDEALGRGKLADARLAIYERSRIRLTPLLLRALDELPPLTGTLLGTPGPPALLAPWAVVARGEPLPELAARLAAQIGGAILAAHDPATPADLFLEARARAAVALLRVELPTTGTPTAPTDPSILVIDDESIAELLDIPLL